MVKFVNMSRLLYSHIFKYTVLEQANLLYCATATVQSCICDKKTIYNLYKQKIMLNITERRTADSAISNNGNAGIVALQTAKKSGQ
jgi:hypothetical protein